MYSPLEQFEIYKINMVSLLGNCYCIIYLLTNQFYFSVLLCLLGGVFYFFLLKRNIKKSIFLKILEKSYRQIILEFESQLTIITYKHFHFIIVLFFSLVLINVQTLIPFSFALTGQLFSTMSFSCIFFFGIIFLGLTYIWINFLKIFIPHGVPFYLIPLLFIIEILSYISRVFSLGIRLFANIMAGHSLIYILSSFVISGYFLGNYLLIKFSVIAPMAVILSILVLESFIAVLQAYVFVILVIIYFRDIRPTDLLKIINPICLIKY